jgi:hypothetical protein
LSHNDTAVNTDEIFYYHGWHFDSGNINFFEYAEELLDQYIEDINVWPLVIAAGYFTDNNVFKPWLAAADAATLNVVIAQFESILDV